MAIADTVWERLARFNAPHRGTTGARGETPGLDGAIAAPPAAVLVFAWLTAAAGAAARLLMPLTIWLGWAALRLLRHLGLVVWYFVLPGLGWLIKSAAWFSWQCLPGMLWALRWMVISLCVGAIGILMFYEIRTSHFESTLFSRLASGLRFAVEPGPAKSLPFPKAGPYDTRLGYTQLPQFIDALIAQRYTIESQARWSPDLVRFVHAGAFPLYREKDKAGLRIFDRSGGQIYEAQFPERTYRNFANIPRLAVESLLFVEDRYLLDGQEPERNPAIEWKRFALAAGARVAGLVVPGLHEGGGSTLATQIEKFRHSPRGVTGGIGEKLKQMLSASARAYADGPNTLKRREQIVATYLNSTPLAAMPGYGEIIGVPEALWVWFGTDFEQATKILNARPRNAAEMARKGVVYRQVLSLLLSERSPTYYLVGNRDALSALADKYLRVLCDAGVISPALRDAALAAKLDFRTEPPPLTAISYVRQKATQEVRNRLVGMLNLPDLYSLDRLDLTAETAIDTAAQQRVVAVLQKLSDPAFLRANGMVGKQLLGGGDPAKVNWSFVLYERGADRNYVRIHADSLNSPFDINSGAKLQLGSTAKLRTMITYLDIIADLHSRMAALPKRELTKTAGAAEDPLTRWAASYLASHSDRSLQPMLDAAMQRHYSAAPGTFFTGGGTQSFGNFESSENYGSPTVEVAFQHSINLAFVRLLSDIVNYYTVASGYRVGELLNNPDDPQRKALLQRFVDLDSRRFLTHFYNDYKSLDADQAMALLAKRTRPDAKRLATVFLSMYPQARLGYFHAFLAAHLPEMNLSEDEIWNLYLTYSPQRLSLADRGYVSGIHPLELWTVRYLQQHPKASFKDVLAASEQVRQEVYSWLYDGSMEKQNTRIRILMEQDAFKRIADNWHKVGYPFARLVPSLGTAIGASGDRPSALADLMGIITHDGVRVPAVAIEHLHFAAHTPYETNLAPASKPERVMPVEVAQTVKHALMAVVADGTASRLRGVYTAADGSPLPVGGKTGTGDNRFDRFARGGGIISSRVVDRTATFVFFLGDRYFGTVTAYASGEDAAKFSYTSALAVQLLKVLQPELKPLIDAPASGQALIGSSRS